jgi:hypothetical protein
VICGAAHDIGPAGVLDADSEVTCKRCAGTVAYPAVTARVQRREALTHRSCSATCHVAGERVRASVLGPGTGPVQVPAQAAEQAPGRRVADHAAGLADDLRVRFAERDCAAEAGEHDPDLGRIQQRRRVGTYCRARHSLDRAGPGDRERPWRPTTAADLGGGRVHEREATQ